MVLGRNASLIPHISQTLPGRVFRSSFKALAPVGDFSRMARKIPLRSSELVDNCQRKLEESRVPGTRAATRDFAEDLA